MTASRSDISSCSSKNSSVKAVVRGTVSAGDGVPRRGEFRDAGAAWREELRPPKCGGDSRLGDREDGWGQCEGVNGARRDEEEGKET